MYEDIIGITITKQKYHELEKYKKEYHNLKEDAKKMSEELYKLMKEKYDNMTYEERVKLHEKEICRSCRYNFIIGCPYINNLSQDILCPIECDYEKKSFIPGKKICDKFEWD